jgi:hypothetical protein
MNPKLRLGILLIHKKYSNTSEMERGSSAENATRCSIGS